MKEEFSQRVHWNERDRPDDLCLLQRSTGIDDIMMRRRSKIKPCQCAVGM